MAGDEVKEESKSAVTVMQNVSIPPPTQLSWSGNMSETWKFFKQKFKIYLIASKINIEDSSYQTALLLSVIGDRALKVYNNFVFGKGESKDDFQVVMSKFDNYFMPDKNVTYERHKFFLRDQKPGEKIDQYVTDLRDLSSTCDFGDLTDSLIRDRVILGIKDMSMKDCLLRTKDLTLVKAVELCRTSEITKSQLQGLSENPNSTGLDIDNISSRKSHRPKYQFKRTVPEKINSYPSMSTVNKCN